MPKIQRLFGHAQNTRAVYLFSNGTIEARWSVSLQPEVRGQKLDQRLIDAFETIVAKEVQEQEGERDEDERTTVYRMNEKQAKAVMRRLTAEVWRERKSSSKSPDDAALSRWHRLVTEHFVGVKDDTAAVERLLQDKQLQDKQEVLQDEKLQEALDNVGKNYFTIEKDDDHKFMMESQLEQVKQVSSRGSD